MTLDDLMPDAVRARVEEMRTEIRAHIEATKAADTDRFARRWRKELYRNFDGGTMGGKGNP
jgi:hypothetical protein